MNCAECQTEPLTPEHYCPCCGRKLSLQERRAVEATSPDARCLSCGGLSADGNLCKSCKETFAPVIGSATITKPSVDSATARTQRVIAVDKKAEVTLPPPVVKVDAPKVVALKIEDVKAETAKAVADQTAKAHLAKGANPAPVAPVTRRPIVPAVPASPQRRSRTPMVITAFAVVVVAIGAAEGARRLGLRWPPRVAREGQPVQATPAVEGVTPDTRSAAKVLAENRASAVAPAQAAARPKPRTAAERRGGVRQENSSDQHVLPVVPPTPAPEKPASAPTRPPALVAAESPRVPAQPTGRFFEQNDVDEAPQIATRVEPQLPANLSVRPNNDVVVVRVLVSATGHPFRVSLLRGSRSGRSADEAVVAAVTRWTFSPAKKRGEPVNCWYNIGVPLGQAN